MTARHARAIALSTAAALLGAAFSAATVAAPGPAVAAPVPHAVGVGGTASRADVSGPGSFVPLSSERILDTRVGVGAPASPVPSRGSVSFTVTGTAGVPATSVGAVVFNLAVAGPSASGYVSAYPAGHARPVSSTINFAAGETRAHLVVVAPGAGGQVSLYNGTSGPMDLLADLSGYFTAGPPSAGGEFQPLVPARLLDTRIGVGATKGPARNQRPITLQVTGRVGVPSTGVGSVVLNLTATQATAAGWLGARQDTGVDLYDLFAPTVNFQKGETASNLVIAPVSPQGTVTLNVNLAGTVQEVADVYGYVSAGSPSAAGRLGSVPPGRLLDTRVGSHAMPAHATLTVPVAGHILVPTQDVSAVVLDLTVATPAAGGYLTAYPSDVARPVASSINFSSHTLANTVMLPLSADGSISIYNGSNAPENLIVDVSAFVGPIPGGLTWSARTAFTGDWAGYAHVSCASATLCIATEGDQAFRYDGHAWSAATTVGAQTLHSVSCVAPAFCVAGAAGAVYVYRGAGWTRMAVGTSSTDLDSVSCASSTFCVAGEEDDASHVWIYRGTTWTSTSTPLTDGGPGNGGGLVSCPTTSFCMEVAGDGGAASFNGGTWTSYGKPGVAPVSCTSATFCVGVNGSTVRTFNGTTWSLPTTVSATPNLPLETVTCSSSSFCIALTPYSVLFYDGTAWTTPVGFDFADFYVDISCSPSRTCTAVDSSGAFVGA